MCIAEVSFSDEVPAAVALNEALEVARLFVDDDAVRFINGVLDNALKSIKQEKTD
jgi:N utilization substance protein B